MSKPLAPDHMEPSATEGEMLATTASDEVAYIIGSVPIVLLPQSAVGDPSSMATYAPNAPYGTIVRFKAV